MSTGIEACDAALRSTTGTDADGQKAKCATEIQRLVVNDASLNDLRAEYKKLKKAYTPLNLLMERARDIPLASVWPGRAANERGPRKEELQDFVRAEIARAASGWK
jgi:hypothetical protein